MVDNASMDDSVSMISAEFPETQVIELRENRGLDGYSAGFEHSRGEFIFQMDNDSLMPDASVLSQVVRRFQEGHATGNGRSRRKG